MSLQRTSKLQELTSRIKDEVEITEQSYLEVVLKEIDYVRRHPQSYTERNLKDLFDIKSYVEDNKEKGIPMKFFYGRKDQRIQSYVVM